MKIVLKSQLNELNQVILDSSKKLSIGRSTSNDIVIKNTIVSSYHLILFMKENRAYIMDRDSSNGTYVNGKKLEVNQPYEVKEQDFIEIGTSKEVAFEIQYKEHILKENEKTEVQTSFIKKVYTIGRSPSSDIHIDTSVISATHLRIEQKNNLWYFYDNDSTNGTYLNSQHNLVLSGELKEGEVLYLGNYKLQTNRILKFLNKKNNLNGEKSKFTKNLITLGRDPKSNIYIDHPSVSFHHAELIKRADGYEIKDLNSTNGTYVNGIEVRKKSNVKIGDEISLGIHSFILLLDDSNQIDIKKKKFTEGYDIEAKNISIVLPNGTKLLDDISFTVYAGELVGLMGLSGAGKTTLLKVLNGYDAPSQGSAYINGYELSSNYNVLKTAIGYVPQDDIVHPELTVKEALQYYAKLRLPSDMSKKEIDQRIDNILKKLGIHGTADTIIGSPDTLKGISGGQRKRVNLAMELLAEPKVIFLDEPTSGLSAVDTKMVMEELQKLTKEGTTIIITIHQPSIDNYKFMDNQIILSYGKLAYYGATYPNSIEFFNPNSDNKELINNPDNALIGLDQAEKKVGEDKLDAQKERNQKGVYWKNSYRQSKDYTEFVENRASSKSSQQLKNTSPSGLAQWLTLTKRYLKIKLKDIANTSILLAQAPLIAIMIAMLFSKSDYINMPVTLFFVLAISAIWFGTINASREIVSEKPIFERERMTGVKLMPYLMSKFVVLSFLCILQTIALVGIVELLLPLGFNDALKEVFLLIFLTSLGGLSIGLLVSTLAKSQAQALGLIPLVLLPMIIFGGGMLSIKQMSKNDNPFAYYMSQVTPTKWALEEIISIYVKEANRENDCVENSQIVWNSEEKLKHLGKSCSEVYKEKTQESVACKARFENCIESRDFSKANYGEHQSSTFLVYLMLILFIIFPLILVLVILKRRDKQ